MPVPKGPSSKSGRIISRVGHQAGFRKPIPTRNIPKRKTGSRKPLKEK